MTWKQGYDASGQGADTYNLSAVATTLSTPRKRAHLRMAPKFMGSCRSGGKYNLNYISYLNTEK